MSSSTSFSRYASKVESLKASRPKTVLMDEKESVEMLRKTIEKKKEKTTTSPKKFKIIKEEIDISGSVYTKTTFIPVESKRQRFWRKLNKK